MTSDNLPLSESDNPNLKVTESSEPLPADKLPTEVKADAQDIWSDSKISDSSLESPADTSEQPDFLAEIESPSQPDTPEVNQNFELDLESETGANDVNNTSSAEPELFVDTWLEESVTEPAKANLNSPLNLDDQVAQLEQQKAQLQQEIAQLKVQKEQLLTEQLQELQSSLASMVEEGTKELRERKTALRIEIEQLERRQLRINQEMRSNFAGSSKELAIRVQGFKEYLVGSLQDLVTAADKLELGKTPAAPPRTRERNRNRETIARDERGREDRRRRSREERSRSRSKSEGAGSAQFAEPTFAEQSRRIRQLLDQYRNNPDYYGSPWKLRRTFETNQAQKVQEWFFGQGGRGTVDSMGSRLQNILVASAAISILHSLYSDRCRILVLTDTPENLGEWRRGLQDCLGISRNDFGSNRGVTLFDAPEVLVQRAERLLSDKLLPVIVIDESEELLNPSILKFPIWMAFASSNKSTSANYLY